MSKQKKQWPTAAVILFDVLLTGALLNVFALFHHVIPMEGGGPKQNIVFGEPASGNETETPAQALPAQPEGTGGGESGSSGQFMTTEVLSSTPSPAPVAIGDFSATFPTGPISQGSVGSYETDTLRIVVDEKTTEDATYYVADVWIRNIQEYKTGFAKGKYGRSLYSLPSTMAEECGAILALSGDCYGARHDGIVIRNGDLYRESVVEDVCILYADGVMETYYAGEFNLEDAVARGAYQGWSFGPKLIDQGAKPESYNTSSEIKNHNPRSAIGYYEPGHYCLVMVDGRSETSRGMTLSELSDLFLSMGCKDAYNLDGGRSSMMVFGGSVVGNPYKDGREISDIIYFAKGE